MNKRRGKLIPPGWHCNLARGGDFCIQQIDHVYVIERFEGPEGDYSLSGTGKGGMGSLMRGQWKISAQAL